jgi:ABC-type oligopeptide transport system ATPase subunit
MISLSNLTKYYGDQLLFEGASLQFNPGERYGIVGANGCGKSTLLRILTGEETASGGELSIAKRARLGVLRQDHFQYERERILDVVMMGNRPLWDAMAEKERILARAEQHFDAERYTELEDLGLLSVHSDGRSRVPLMSDSKVAAVAGQHDLHFPCRESRALPDGAQHGPLRGREIVPRFEILREHINRHLVHSQSLLKQKMTQIRFKRKLDNNVTVMSVIAPPRWRRARTAG